MPKFVADYLKRELVSHTRKVTGLYKAMCRDIDWWEDDWFEARFKRLQLRAKFDMNKNIKDIRLGKALYEKTLKEHEENMHPYHARGQPILPFSKEGIAYQRNLESPDYVMDWYHQLEKAQYPYYFAKREAMKQEYVELWKKKMYKPGEIPEPKDRA